MYCISESKRIFKMLLIAGIYLYGERERERERERENFEPDVNALFFKSVIVRYNLY